MADEIIQGYDRRAKNLQDVYLSGTNLQGVDLSGYNLKRTNFSGANLQGVNLSDANLQHANLSQTYLQGANLSGADMQHANLSQANLQGANLSDANMQDATLRYANLQGANLNKANMWDYTREYFIYRTKIVDESLDYLAYKEMVEDPSLQGAQLHGAYCDGEEGIMSFHERINSRRGTGTDLSGVLQASENINEIAEMGILTDEMADKIIEEYHDAIKKKWERISVVNFPYKLDKK